MGWTHHDGRPQKSHLDSYPTTKRRLEGAKGKIRASRLALATARVMIDNRALGAMNA